MSLTLDPMDPARREWALAALATSDHFPVYRPQVQDDAEEPWALCLMDLHPRQRQHVDAETRTITTRAGRRTVKQKLRAMLPRLDLGGMA